MSGLESVVLTVLVNSVWQIPLLVTAGWVAARAVRPLGAAAEHRVWVGVLLGEALLPVSSLLPADWLRIALPWSRADAGGAGQVSVTMGAGSVVGGGAVPVHLWTVVALLYGGVTAWFALRFLWRWTRVTELRRESVAVELRGEAAEPWAQCAARLGVGEVAVATSSRISGPVTLGFARPLVLLPPGMLDRLGDVERRTVIAHELAHIRRQDFLKNLIYEAVTLPISYHPLAGFTRERVTASREMVCDRMAAEITGRSQYARSLLRLATTLGGMPARLPHTLGIFDTNVLERRLMELTEKRKEMRGVRRLLVTAGCLALGIATCGSAMALRMHVNGAAAAAIGNAPAQPKGPIAVKGSIMAGQRISGKVPVYPPEAKKARIQGAVLLETVIGKDGSVETATVTSGPQELRQSALDAVRTWKYKPFLLNGDPVEVKTTIRVVYSLGK